MISELNFARAVVVIGSLILLILSWQFFLAILVVLAVGWAGGTLLNSWIMK